VLSYSCIDDINSISSFFDKLNQTAAYDFETASRLSLADRRALERELELSADEKEQQEIRVKLNATGLSHPSLSRITHLSVGLAEDLAVVAIAANKDIEKYIYEYLTTTTNKQLWHNTLFDFQHIYYNTGKFPKDYEDTMLMAKAFLNNTNPRLAKIGLKELMGDKYGDWGKRIKPEMFTIESIRNKELVKYAAVDGCAIYALYQEIISG
jgi:hypothetical protein